MPRDYIAEHRNVLDRAERIYIERSKARGQMWEEFPPSDMIRHMQERIRRIEVANGMDEDNDAARIAVMDAIDLVNYAVFFVRRIEAGSRG